MANRLFRRIEPTPEGCFWDSDIENIYLEECVNIKENKEIKNGLYAVYLELKAFNEPPPAYAGDFILGQALLGLRLPALGVLYSVE